MNLDPDQRHREKICVCDNLMQPVPHLVVVSTPLNCQATNQRPFTETITVCVCADIDTRLTVQTKRTQCQRSVTCRLESVLEK